MDENRALSLGSPPASRLSLYEAIREAALRQRAAIESDDLASFHDLLVQREALIAEVEGAGEVERGGTAELLRDIMTLDEQNQRLLSAKIEEAQRELNTMRGGEQILRSYTTLAEREARFVDRRG